MKSRKILSRRQRKDRVLRSQSMREFLIDKGLVDKNIPLKYYARYVDHLLETGAVDHTEFLVYQVQKSTEDEIPFGERY